MYNPFSIPELFSRRGFIKAAGCATAWMLMPPFSAMGESALSAWSPCSPDAVRYMRLQPAFCRYGSYDVQRLEGAEIRIFGWFMCEDPDGRFVAPERLYCILDQQELWQGSVGMSRADVGDVFPGAPLEVGFELRCPAPEQSISVWVLDTKQTLWQGRRNAFYPPRKDDL